MLIRVTEPWQAQERDVTPETTYLNRRQFMAGTAAAGVVLAAGSQTARADILREKGGTPLDPIGESPLSTTGEKVNSFEDITTYNNFYEFGVGKDDPAQNSSSFKPLPWTIAIDGLVNKPMTLDVETLLHKMPLEQRVYRMRCVEAWSMVIPWVGIPLKTILDSVEPQGSAKYVRFETLYDPKRFVGQNRQVIHWPYVEGLRLDEANHPLAILAVGLYGRSLMPANGAPVRLVTPWKYGFKGIKSIVRISLVEKQPLNTWQETIADEYGFYANVNPTVDHPRWSQASERRIGEFSKRKTLMFNGYGDSVASLYSGMDLRANY